MTLALLCQFTAQHVSDVNTSIFRNLRLLSCMIFACLAFVNLMRIGLLNMFRMLIHPKHVEQ